MNEVIKNLMKDREITQAEMAFRLKKGSGDTVWQALNTQKDISIDAAIEYLAQVGYKLVIAPHGTRVPDGGFEIEEVASHDS